MSIHLGNNKISKVYIGNTRIGKAYLGNTLVYTSDVIYFDRGIIHEDLGRLTKNSGGGTETPVLWIYTGAEDGDNGKTSFIRSVNKIDVTHLDVIHFECFSNRPNCRVGIDKKILTGWWDYPEYVETMPEHEYAGIEHTDTESAYFGNVDLDVSEATGEYYLYLAIAYPKHATAYTRKVWAE